MRALILLHCRFSYGKLSCKDLLEGWRQQMAVAPDRKLLFCRDNGDFKYPEVRPALISTVLATHLQACTIPYS